MLKEVLGDDLMFFQDLKTHCHFQKYFEYNQNNLLKKDN